MPGDQQRASPGVEAFVEHAVLEGLSYCNRKRKAEFNYREGWKVTTEVCRRARQSMHVGNPSFAVNTGVARSCLCLQADLFFAVKEMIVKLGFRGDLEPPLKLKPDPTLGFQQTLDVVQ